MDKNTAEALSSGPNSSSVNATPGKVTGTARSTEQKEKRIHSEVADSSLGDEFTSIQRQLDQLNSEIRQTREDFKTLMTKDEMKVYIKTTIQNMITNLQTKVEESMIRRVDKKLDEKLDSDLEDKLEEKLDAKIKEKMKEASDRMDMLTYETVHLKEEVDKLQKELTKTKKVAQTASQRANTNEQYSRKNNIKIMGVVEDADEDEEKLIRKIQQILESKANVKLEDNKIMAIHRIPGKVGMPKPVLIKLRNNNEKTKIMKKRKEMKHGGYRLVDDVTKANTKLINRLMEHKDIDSAWYFNGSVYGKSKSGTRFKFEIHSDISEVLEGKKKGPGAEPGADPEADPEAEPMATF